MRTMKTLPNQKRGCIPSSLVQNLYLLKKNLELVLSLPQLPLESSSKRSKLNNMDSAYHLHDYKDHEENLLLPTDNHSLHPRFPEVENKNEFSSPSPDAENEVFSGAEEILHTPVSRRLQNEMDISYQDHDVVHDGMLPPAHEAVNDLKDSELSPRLTNFIKSGVVPESPINDSGTWNSNRGDFTGPALASSLKCSINSLNLGKTDVKNGSSVEMDIPCPNDNGIRTPELHCHTGAVGACSSPTPVIREMQTPFTKLSNTSSSENWLLGSGTKPEKVESQFRRLCKHGDLKRKIPIASMNQTGPSEKLKTSRRADGHKSTKLLKDEKKQLEHVAAYIEEEAEVSSDAMASDDEEDAQGGSSYEDSFIDDGLNPTASNTQPGSSKIDMMAIYRRSLLTQSPFPRLPSFPTSYSPDSVVQSSRADGSGSSAGTKLDDAPQTGLKSTAGNSEFSGAEIPAGMMESRLGSRKRKLSLHQAHSLPMLNLDKEFGDARENTSMHVHVDRSDKSIDILEDDQFYEGIDLDALEEEATKLLKNKSECSTQKTTALPEPIQPNLDILGSPSFDLGI